MTALSPVRTFGRAHPDWTFVILWYAATFAGAILYAVPVLAAHIIVGLEDPDAAAVAQMDPRRLVLAGVLTGAACGSTIGVAQWLVLRRRLKGTGLWIVATIAGYASLGLLPLLASLFQPRWLAWAETLVISGKLQWLAREAVPNPDAAWLNASWPAGAVTLVLFGLVLGLAQWVVLRGRVAYAAWWIGISAAGWALLALASTSIVPWAPFALFSWDVPVILAAAGLVWLQSRPARE